MGYTVHHNVTLSGNITSVHHNTSRHVFPFSIDIPNACSGSNLTISVAALNVLGTGEWVTLNIPATFIIVGTKSMIDSTVCIRCGMLFCFSHHNEA